MTSPVRVETYGDKRLAATSHAAALRIQHLEEVNRGIGERIKTRGASNAPKKTGRLARSVSATSNAREVRVTANTDYANVVHYGHQSVPAKPFLANALRDTERANVDDIERHVQAATQLIKGV